jgi:hypothetical protein
MGEATEDLKAEDLRALIEELKSEVQRLKDRPPMACFSCEQFNEKLADELDAIKRFAVHIERENLALNTWLASWAVATNNDLLEDYLAGKRHEDVVAAFKTWWKTHRDIE